MRNGIPKTKHDQNSRIRRVRDSPKDGSRLFAVLIISSLAFSVSAAEVNSTAAGKYRPSSAITVYINDLPLTFDAEPELISGTTFVPVRPIFEALNIDFQWSDIRREVTADNGTERIHFKSAPLRQP